MKIKGNLVIALGTTGERAFAAGTMLVGLKKHMQGTDYDVVIYTKGLSEKDATCLNKIHSCILRAYRFPLIDVSMKKFERISEMSFSRLECFNLLNEYKNVIWLDTDILILKNIESMLTRLNDGIGMYVHKGIPMSVSFAKSVPTYKMNEDCYNAGIIALNENLKNHESIAEWCYQCTKDYYDYIASEQAVINMMIQKLNLNPEKLDEIYNCPVEYKNDNTVIIHTWGNRKFWNDIYHPVWEGYFQKWRKMGGSSAIVDAYFLRRAKILFKAMKRKIKKAVFK